MLDLTCCCVKYCLNTINKLCIKTSAKKYKVGAPRAENASELEDIAGGRAVERWAFILFTPQP